MANTTVMAHARKREEIRVHVNPNIGTAVGLRLETPSSADIHLILEGGIGQLADLVIALTNAYMAYEVPEHTD